MLWGGFITNFVWSLILIFQNNSFKQFAGEPGINPMRAAATSGDTLVDFDPLDPSTYDRLAPRTLISNYIFAAMAGVIWYFQFFFYSMGQTKMGKYDFSSWTLHMASIIIFATLWGLALKEWHGTSMRTKLLVTCGLSLLVGSRYCRLWQLRACGLRELARRSCWHFRMLLGDLRRLISDRLFTRLFHICVTIEANGFFARRPSNAAH